MAEMARAVGKDTDARAFEARAADAKTSFHKTLFDEDAGIYRDGVVTDHHSIHANFFPLAFGLIPDENVAGVVDWLAQADMRCSPYAAQYFMDALFSHNQAEKALDLILADGDRSWKHMLDSGTTISWEAWDLKYKPNQDWNHAWGAAPANLLPRHVLGAQPGTPGWNTASIRPCPGDLSFARGKVPTSRGPIQIEWTNEESFDLSLSLPPGMTAVVDLPATKNSVGVFAADTPVPATKRGDRWLVDDVVSGSVHFEVK